MSSDNSDELNYDCNYNMFLAKTLLQNQNSPMSVQDRSLAVKWIRKLSVSNNNIPEMKLRNDFMYYLVLNIQNNKLKAPFTNEPPLGTIMEIAHLLPQGTDAAAELESCAAWGGSPETGKGQQPFLYTNSPDGGAFLASQPIPRCGAFCYLAVISKSNT